MCCKITSTTQIGWRMPFPGSVFLPMRCILSSAVANFASFVSRLRKRRFFMIFREKLSLSGICVPVAIPQWSRSRQRMVHTVYLWIAPGADTMPVHSGVFKGINFMGLGMQIDVYAERLTDTQLGLFCLAGPVATLLLGWVVILLAKRICTSKSKLFKAVMWYVSLAILIIDPLYLSILCGFFGGGDMNGIKLLFPEIAVRIVSAVIGVIHGVVIWKYLLPSYTKSFQKDNIHGE